MTAALQRVIVGGVSLRPQQLARAARACDDPNRRETLRSLLRFGGRAKGIPGNCSRGPTRCVRRDGRSRVYEHQWLLWRISHETREGTVQGVSFKLCHPDLNSPGLGIEFSETTDFPFAEKVCRFSGIHGMVSLTWKSCVNNSEIVP